MLHCLWFSANRQSFEIVLISLRRPPFEIAFKWSRYAKMLPIFCTFRLKEHNYFREKRERREGKKSGHCPSREEDAPQREATPSSHEGHVTSFHLVREMPGASKTLSLSFPLWHVVNYVPTGTSFLLAVTRSSWGLLTLP